MGAECPSMTERLWMNLRTLMTTLSLQQIQVDPKWPYLPYRYKIYEKLGVRIWQSLALQA